MKEINLSFPWMKAQSCIHKYKRERQNVAYILAKVREKYSKIVLPSNIIILYDSLFNTHTKQKTVECKHKDVFTSTLENSNPLVIPTRGFESFKINNATRSYKHRQE